MQKVYELLLTEERMSLPKSRGISTFCPNILTKCLAEL